MVIKTSSIFTVVSFMASTALITPAVALANHCSIPMRSENNCSQGRAPEKRTPGDTLTIADPTIFPYQGKYYLMGTSGDHSVTRGFKAFESEDLIHWHRITVPGYPDYLVLDSARSFGNKGFWAPQLLLPPCKNDTRSSPEAILLAYTANEQIAIARSTNGVKGPFTQKVQKNGTSQNRNTAGGFTPLFNDGFKHIDPFIFTDPVTHKSFIYYVKLDKGNNIYVSELNEEKDGNLSVQEGTEIPCIHATEHWENTAGAGWPVTEGPTVLYHKGYYYLFYSANDFRSADYAVGYATARSPAGPWTKSPGGPVISGRQTGLKGTGHGDVFMDKKGAYYYVFHAHNSAHKVAPRKTYLIRFSFEPDSQEGQPGKIRMDYRSVRPLLVN